MNPGWIGVVRLSCLLAGVLLSASACATESSAVELGPDEGVETMAASGDTLAIGVAQREPYDPRKGVGALEDRAAIALFREAAPIVRTPLEPGYLRGIVPAPSGFVALRVVFPGGTAPVVAHVFRVDLSGKVTVLPPLTMDAIGLWVGEKGELFVYSTTAVVRWPSGGGAWSPVRLHPSVAATPIRKMVRLKGGEVAVINDRAIMGLARLEDAPVFVNDLNAYPYSLKLFGDGERWWLVVPRQDSQKVMQVTTDGGVREVATMRVVNVHELLFSGDDVIVVCAREGGNVHKSSFYILGRAGAAPMRGPRKLPDDTTITAVWGKAIASGGAMRRVSNTTIQ
jgi:hypothetical protein